MFSCCVFGKDHNDLLCVFDECYMVHFHVFISRGVGSNLQFANKLVGSGYISILVCMIIQ